ncbi:MAG: DUF3179 domain-containing protein [Spirochaetaceae bacterium]|nr:MAG: DUF3179 domain-containing protein [Spirochaetaceae bacterium]
MIYCCAVTAPFLTRYPVLPEPRARTYTCFYGIFCRQTDYREVWVAMYPLVIFVGLASSFAAAFQLQAVTFVPRLSLYSIHKFENKRRLLRSIAGVCLIVLVALHRHETGAVAVMIVCGVFLVMSFVIDNTKGFRDLNEEHIRKSPGAVLDGDTIVVGVELPSAGNVCYAIEDMVLPRHVLNDRLGDTPLLVSYCAACRSCIVYNPVIEGKRLSFQVIAVWRRNMVMRDRETGTLWQQATGEAIYGELKGRALQMLMSQQMRLDHWRSAHPDTVIAVESETAPKGRIPKPMLRKMLKVTERAMARGFTEIGHELPLREKVFGVTVNGVSKAYPLSRLRDSREFRDSVGETPVQIVYQPETNAISGVNLSDGSALVLESHWWFGWKEFHPFTEVWPGDGDRDTL